VRDLPLMSENQCGITLLSPSNFVALSADPLLVWNYGVMAAIAGIAGILFWISVRKLDAQEDVLNNLDEGHVDANKI
jgi:proton-dependent oligopeptide transporter, POT family